MPQDAFPVALGGRTWSIPHLPFRIIKTVHPMLMQRGAAVFGGGEAGMMLRVDEAAMDELAEAAFRCIAVVDPALTREAFFDLPFSFSDLAVALPSLMQACGLRAAPKGEAPAGDAAEKK